MGLPAQIQQVAGLLRARRYVLVLDNIESITGSPAAIPHTLPAESRTELAGFLSRLRGGRTLVVFGSREAEDWLAPHAFEQNVYRLPGLDGQAASVLVHRILSRLAGRTTNPTRATRGAEGAGRPARRLPAAADRRAAHAERPDPGAGAGRSAGGVQRSRPGRADQHGDRTATASSTRSPSDPCCCSPPSPPPSPPPPSRPMRRRWPARTRSPRWGRSTSTPRSRRSSGSAWPLPTRSCRTGCRCCRCCRTSCAPGWRPPASPARSRKPTTSSTPPSARPSTDC